MSVSAIIPVHNEARVLERVLNSIERQLRRPDDLIIVLDDCTDGSEAIARSCHATLVRVRVRNMAAAILAGVSHASGEILVMFDGNTLVPSDYIARLLEVFKNGQADLVEWHGGLMLLPRSTLERFGTLSLIHLWTLEYFLRVESLGGRVVRLNGPHERLKRSPLKRNIRYGIDYAELSARYDIAPFFRIGTKSGLVPDLFATFGTTLGHLRSHRLRHALGNLPSAIRRG